MWVLLFSGLPMVFQLVLLCLSSLCNCNCTTFLSYDCYWWLFKCCCKWHSQITQNICICIVHRLTAIWRNRLIFIFLLCFSNISQFNRRLALDLSFPGYNLCCCSISLISVLKYLDPFCAIFSFPWVVYLLV